MGNLSAPDKKPVILCVANWDSNVGYAWWLMESFWLQIHTSFRKDYDSLIAYPSISLLPAHIANSSIGTIEFNFRVNSVVDLIRHIVFIRTHKIKVIYFSDHPTSHWSYFFFRCAGVKKIIVHDHTPGIRTRPHGLRKMIKTFRARTPFINVDAAIGATEFVKSRLINVNCLPAHKCFAAPNGLPELSTAIAPIDLHQQLQLQTDTRLIVSTGRANIYKGLDFALQVIACLIFQRNIKNIHFIFCGDGPDLDQLKSMAESLNIKENVSFLGRVNNINQILAACDIAFHPSRGEVGYSLAILEYMRAGLPVVVSDNPSVCEANTHGHDGLIYREGDISDAAQALAELLSSDELCTSLGQQGQKTIQQKYLLKNTHHALIDALSAILQKG